MNAPDPREERVSLVTGDRPCIQCGYALTGQPILREPHYGMLICRCAECGTVTSLQDYPLLGRWGRRWGAVLLGLWALFVSLVVLGSSGALVGLSTGMATEVLGPLRWELRDAHRGTTAPGDRAPILSFAEWWAQQDQAALAARYMPPLREFREDIILMAVFFPMLLFSIGVLLALMTPHLRTGRQLALALVVVGIAAGIGLIINALWHPAPETIRYSDLAAYSMRGGRWLFGILGGLGFAFLLGLLLGRPIFRGLIRALLPPRARAGLAVLWRIDGREPPSPLSRG